MALDDQENDEEHLGKLALRLANVVVIPMVLKSALELNIIDMISAAGDGMFLSPCEIASRIPTRNPEAPMMLDRMLRLLASYGILNSLVRSKDDGEVERLYGAGPLCRFFSENENGGSFGPLLLLLNDKVSMQSWYHLNDVILEGGIPFNKAYGMGAFEYLATDQRFNKVFNRAMSSHTTLIMNKILDIYKGFEDLEVLVDVGGGIGIALNTITSKYPHIKGINYDMPHVLADAPSYPGVEHVSGDMFESVPKGDAIFMKLLRNCWEALPPSGKVIIMESILPEIPENTISSNDMYRIDMVMFAHHSGGKERTQKEFEALALKTGFLSCQVKCCAYHSWVLELYKKAE